MQTFLAAQQGKTVDELLKEITEQIDQDIAKEENKFNKNALKALKKFVNDPDEIKITVSPKEPVPLGKLQGIEPVKVPEVLNMKIKTWFASAKLIAETHNGSMDMTMLIPRTKARGYSKNLNIE